MGPAACRGRESSAPLSDSVYCRERAFRTIFAAWTRGARIGAGTVLGTEGGVSFLDERRRCDRREREVLGRNAAERRRTAERRHPELREISFREWVACKARVLRRGLAEAPRGSAVALPAMSLPRPAVSSPRRAAERRCVDLGTPLGWRERRRSPERRLPEVRELSFADFLLET